METSSIVINTIITLIVYYIFYLREFVLAKRYGFKCQRCGNCCKLRVKMFPEDIKSLEETGHKKEDFLYKNKYLKKINGYCVFLTLNNGITSCSIENNKPYVCRRFPIGKGIFGKKIDIRCRTCAFKLF
jgi:Fe-S-cluster containining protein